MEAQRQLQLFKDPNDAYEKRGYANAVSELRAVIQELYQDRSDHIGQELATADSIIEGAEDARGTDDDAEPKPKWGY